MIIIQVKILSRNCTAATYSKDHAIAYKIIYYFQPAVDTQTKINVFYTHSYM